MTLIDSSDSILMLYSYSGFPERSFFIFAQSGDPEMTKDVSHDMESNVPIPVLEEIKTEIDLQGKDYDQDRLPKRPTSPVQPITPQERDSAMARDIQVKMNMMSGLSIILTLMSILVAFRYAYSVFK